MESFNQGRDMTTFTLQKQNYYHSDGEGLEHVKIGSREAKQEMMKTWIKGETVRKKMKWGPTEMASRQNWDLITC